MKRLKLSLLGVRGVVGEAFTPELVVSFAQAFGTYVEDGPIFVSRDTRTSGQMIRSGVLSGLLSTGYEVVDLGVCPTPAMELVVKRHKGAGGVAITAGHNPAEWNALKFVSPAGHLLNAYQGQELLDVLHQGEFTRAAWDGLKPLRRDSSAVPEYVAALVGLFDREAIRQRRFKVAVDCCNGACTTSTPLFLEALGCELVAINAEAGRPFPHDPEPNPDNMNQLRAMVRASGADIGFAQDAEGSRLGIVTEKGDPLSEEYTLCIAADIVLGTGCGRVVTNVCTTSAVDDIAAGHGARVERAKIGEPHIVEAMLFSDACLGGEGSGGVVLPALNHTFDATAVMGTILEHMARTGRPVSDLATAVPRYSMIKENIPCPPDRAANIMSRLRETMEEEPEGASIDFTDGILARREREWVHVRPSMTEPVLRVIAEAPTSAAARAIADGVSSRVRRYMV